MNMKMQLMDDTICAICTPIGPGSVAVIRISGSNSYEIVKKIFVAKNEKDFANLEPRKTYLGDIKFDGRFIDEVICIFFSSPHSLTGEDVVEIHTHGGRVVPNLVIKLLVKLGARIAGPGEYSYRSYQNGKIDLLKAESVATLIASQTEIAANFSTKNINGEISKKFNEIKDLAINLLSEIEARVDFPEDEVPEIDKKRIISLLDNLNSNCKNILETYSKGRLFVDGLRVLILGAPNTGKSTLLNSILNEEKAIVSSTPGTTRDILDADIVYNGIRIVFSDTAGIRDSSDSIEVEGIKRAKDKVQFSDVVIILVDQAYDGDVDHIFDFVPRGKRLIVINKTDVFDKRVKEWEDHREGESPSMPIGDHFIAAKEDKGVAELLNIICLRFGGNKDADFSEGVLTTERQVELLNAGIENLINGKKCFVDGKPMEIVSLEIRSFIDSIADITGEVSNEDIYDELFSKFCIGK